MGKAMKCDLQLCLNNPLWLFSASCEDSVVLDQTHDQVELPRGHSKGVEEMFFIFSRKDFVEYGGGVDSASFERIQVTGGLKVVIELKCFCESVSGPE